GVPPGVAAVQRNAPHRRQRRRGGQLLGWRRGRTTMMPDRNLLKCRVRLATDRMVWPLAPFAHRVVDPWPVQFNGRDLIFYHFCINALNGAAGGAGGTRGPVPWEMGS